MASFLDRARPVMRDPAMLRAYAGWWLMTRGGAERARLDTGYGRLRGFQSFSEYWGTLSNLPTPSERALIARTLGPERVALDVGGNLGQFALLASGTGATVHSFEPVPTTFSRLQANVSASGKAGQIRCHPLALSDRCGSGHMQITPSSATNRMALTGGDIEVTCRTLDAFCADQGIEEVHFLKIDVEGLEPLVVRGAAGLLARQAVRCILLEMCPGNLERLGFTVEDVLSAVQPHGYALYRLGEDGRAAGESLAAAELAAMTVENVLAMPRGYHSA